MVTTCHRQVARRTWRPDLGKQITAVVADWSLIDAKARTRECKWVGAGGQQRLGNLEAAIRCCSVLFDKNQSSAPLSLQNKVKLPTQYVCRLHRGPRAVHLLRPTVRRFVATLRGAAPSDQRGTGWAR